MTKMCTICRGTAASRETLAGSNSLCPTCGGLLRWFLGHYADVEFVTEGGRITPETTFQELSIESLDYVQWLFEAETRFGVTIPNRDAERIRSVGDYLRYIRLQGNVKNQDFMLDRQDPFGTAG